MRMFFRRPATIASGKATRIPGCFRASFVWIANQYMSLYVRLRLDIRKERVEIQHVEQKVEEMKEPKAA